MTRTPSTRTPHTRRPRPTYDELVAMYASHPVIIALAALSPAEREAQYPGMTAGAIAIKQSVYDALKHKESKSASIADSSAELTEPAPVKIPKAATRRNHKPLVGRKRRKDE